MVVAHTRVFTGFPTPADFHQTRTRERAAQQPYPRIIPRPTQERPPGIRAENALRSTYFRSQRNEPGVISAAAFPKLSRRSKYPDQTLVPSTSVVNSNKTAPPSANPRAVLNRLVTNNIGRNSTMRVGLYKHAESARPLSSGRPVSSSRRTRAKAKNPIAETWPLSIVSMANG